MIHHRVDSDIGVGNITILPFSYDSIEQGNWIKTGSPQSHYLGENLYNITNDNQDAINYKVYLSKGTYTLLYMTNSNYNYGIAKFYVDDIEVASFDCYSSSIIYNIIKKQTEIVIDEPGIKTLQLKVDGNNPLASGHYIAIDYIALWRTA